MSDFTRMATSIHPLTHLRGVCALSSVVEPVLQFLTTASCNDLQQIRALIRTSSFLTLSIRVTLHYQHFMARKFTFPLSALLIRHVSAL